MTDIIERAADLIHALYHAMDDTAQHMGADECKCHEPEAFVMDKDTGEALNAAFDKFTDGDEDAHDAIAELRKCKRLEIPVAEGEVRLAVADLERHWRETPNKDLQKWLVDLARLLESQEREIERLKAALAPFAKVAIGFEDGERRRVKHRADEGRAPGPPLGDYTEVRCTLGECRKAAAALSLNSLETREIKP